MNIYPCKITKFSKHLLIFKSKKKKTLDPRTQMNPDPDPHHCQLAHIFVPERLPLRSQAFPVLFKCRLFGSLMSATKIPNVSLLISRFLSVYLHPQFLLLLYPNICQLCYTHSSASVFLFVLQLSSIVSPSPTLFSPQ